MKHNQRVRVTTSYTDETGKQPVQFDGEIVGMGFVNEDNGMRPVYLIKLDIGFYDPTGTNFVSTLVVDRNSAELTPIG